MKKKIIVIGGGMAGMAAAAHLAKQNFSVKLLEKNDRIGGRNRQFSAAGYTFDMGPSWYWMPDIFEQFYQEFGHTTKDFYTLERLNPSYQVIHANQTSTLIPANREELAQLFESWEKGSAAKLALFLKEAEEKYRTAMKEFVIKPSLSIREYINFNLIKKSFQLDLFKSISAHIRKYFKHPNIIELLEFPVLFLGAKPQFTPALFSMMNYADMVLGTWYPKGGMVEISKAFNTILKEKGVEVLTNTTVRKIEVKNGIAHAVLTDNGPIGADIIVSGADYHHTEQVLLSKSYRSYTLDFWKRQILAPSCLIFYLGISKKLPKLEHHNLFFDRPFAKHSQEIYDTHSWPTDPLFYVAVTSKSDQTAPEGCENLFVLIPLSTRLSDDQLKHRYYLDVVLKRIENHIQTSVKPYIEYQRSYCIDDFIHDYNSFRGNAYGLANTLLQTGPFRPKIRSKKVKNLFFTGQLTVPGPGLPPAIISGKVAANTIKNIYLN